MPNPIAFFYDPEKFPLAVLGADSRSMLMDPVTYEVKDLQGGAGEEDSKLKERKDFRATAVFEPYLKTDKNGEVHVKFKLPNPATTFRSTAIAVTKENLRGLKNEILVQNRIKCKNRSSSQTASRAQVLQELLQQTSQTEEEELTVTASSDLLKIEGETTKKVKVPANNSKEIAFKIAAVEAGDANITFTTISNSTKEKLESKLTIESPIIKGLLQQLAKFDLKKSNKNFSQEGLIIPKDIVPNFGIITDNSR